ncbi:MAG: T9SS type A sorting domain-containing protein [Saprospiraceae bacterium]|nr:T9SS type A sorting domain-containing protein [Saprospiraceae bacterium]
MQFKINIILTFLLLCLDLSAQQVGHTTITFIDSSRNNRPIVTEMYYPATSAGDNTPMMAGVFPLIAFGHGFVMSVGAYQNFWDALVPEGYILAFPTSEGGFSPSHANFGKDLAFLITTIQSSGAGLLIPSASVGTTSAIMGHSMGGGSAFLAAKDNTTITTLVSFAAANTNPSAIEASKNVSVPTLLFSGVNDCVTPPSQQQDIMYDSTAAAYKTQLNIIGGGHCFFANSNLACTFGESTCSPSPTITRAAQQSVTNDFLKLWLAYFLKNDCPKAQEFQDSLSVSSRINDRQSQPIACVSGITDAHVTPLLFKIFPNPVKSLVNVEAEAVLFGSVYTVFNSTGKIVATGKINAENTVIEFNNLPGGIYLFSVGGNLKQTFKMIKE